MMTTLSGSICNARAYLRRPPGRRRRGHYIAARFNGPTEAFNHFAQDANFNRDGYRALEDKWAAAIKSGKTVWVKITPSYEGTSMRPTAINVDFTIDGKRNDRFFPNERREGSGGK